MRNLILLFILIAATSCNSGLEGEGTASVKKEFTFTSFNSIEANCNCDITLIPSETSKVVVESHQNLIDNLDLKLKGNELEISEKKNVGQFDLYNILIYLPSDLKEIELNKQARLKTSGTIKADRLKIEANDQSSISQTYLDIKDLKLDISDQSGAVISGIAINLRVSSSDEAIGNFSELQAVEIDFDAEDNSHISLYAMKNLSGKAENNAQVSYKGDPYKNTTEKDRAFINKN